MGAENRIFSPPCDYDRGLAWDHQQKINQTVKPFAKMTSSSHGLQ